MSRGNNTQGTGGAGTGSGSGGSGGTNTGGSGGTRPTKAALAAAPAAEEPWGMVRLKNCFVVGHRAALVHLPEVTWAAWRNGRARLLAWTACGKQLFRASSLLEMPDGMTLCDDCVLADFMPFVVYRFFDAGGALLYIGFTTSFPNRLKTHASSSPWFSQVASWRLVEFDGLIEATAYEAESIRTERPRHNIQHNDAALAAA